LWYDRTNSLIYFAKYRLDVLEVYYRKYFPYLPNPSVVEDKVSMAVVISASEFYVGTWNTGFVQSPTWTSVPGGNTYGKTISFIMSSDET
jgi:hypothetical protein